MIYLMYDWRKTERICPSLTYVDRQLTSMFFIVNRSSSYCSTLHCFSLTSWDTLKAIVHKSLLSSMKKRKKSKSDPYKSKTQNIFIKSIGWYASPSFHLFILVSTLSQINFYFSMSKHIFKYDNIITFWWCQIFRKCFFT